MLESFSQVTQGKGSHSYIITFKRVTVFLVKLMSYHFNCNKLGLIMAGSHYNSAEHILIDTIMASPLSTTTSQKSKWYTSA